MKKLLAGLFFLAVLAAGGALYWELRQPYAAFRENVFLNIPRGTSTFDMAAMLEREGVIRSRWLFLALRALHSRASLQAGEYLFVDPATPRRVFDRIAAGDIFYYELTIPEGSNMFDVAKAVSALGFISSEEFLAAAADPAPIRDLDPEAQSLEGYLFPSTYRLTRHSTAGQLCRQMVDQFLAVWKDLGSPPDVHNTVTLASMIEKETALAEERPIVASVFLNRLDKGMKLDCDPTTIYAALLQDRYHGVIHRSDLDSSHIYNTYQHPGLPPGPISNPGAASLKAALHPAETGFYYFVVSADENGSHQFSRTLAQHQTAVARYKRAIAKNNKTKTARTDPRPAAAGGN